MRRRGPPRLMRATWRTVWSCRTAGRLVGKRKSAPQTGCGLACHVAAQLEVSAEPAGTVEAAKAGVEITSARRTAPEAVESDGKSCRMQGTLCLSMAGSWIQGLRGTRRSAGTPSVNLIHDEACAVLWQRGWGAYSSVFL